MYKSLAQVERAFRSLKTGQLEVRPVSIYNADDVPGHVLVWLLAYYLEWHLRRLADLATLTLNELALREASEHTFPLHARPTPVQQKALNRRRRFSDSMIRAQRGRGTSPIRACDSRPRAR